MDKLRALAKRRKWPLLLLAIALCCAATTTYCLDNFPGFAIGLWAFAMGMLVLTVPLVWGGALFMPKPTSLAILRAHSALYSTILVIAYIADPPDHSAPGALFAAAVWFVLFLVLGIEALVAWITHLRVRKLSLDAKVLPLVYVGITTALLGGWFTGVLIWSVTFPPRVIVAAETAAGDRPYCIDLEKGAARAARDFEGLSMRASNHGGWSMNFHALLVVEEPANRRYMNWSYISGRFESVGDYARNGLHLDEKVRCTPEAHFASGWL